MLRLRKIVPYLLIVGFAIPLLWPLLHPGFFVSDDGEWMIIRLAAFNQTLKTGQFPVRFLETLNHGYGYPVTNFLYPLPFYLGVVLHFLGPSFIDSIKLLFAVDVLAGSIFVFLFLKEKFKLIAAFAGSIAFLSHPYILFDLYKRGSLGELTAIMFAVATILFLTKFLKTSNRIFFSIGSFLWAATIISHNTIGLISVPVIFLVPLVLKETILPKDFLRILVAFGMAVLVSAFFWIPAIGEYGYTRASSIVVANFRDYFLNPVELAKLLGLPILAVVVIGLRQQFSRDSGWLTRISLVGLALSIFFASSLSTIFWERLPLDRIVQFPWRFVSLFVLIAPIIVAGVIKTNKMVIIVGFLLLVGYFFSLSQIHVQRIDRVDAYYETNDDTTTVKGEYLTRYVKNPPTNAPEDRIEIMEGLGSVSGNIVSLSTSGRVRVNKMYYPGMLLYINGLRSEFNYERSGYLEINLLRGKYQTVTKFGETKLRTFANFITIIGLVSLIIISFAINPRRRER